jgi:carbon monoxide dehydrogenase subunit G
VTKVTSSNHVNASLGDVWRQLADFAAIAQWAPNCDHSSWASDIRDGIGAVRRVQVGRIAVLETVIEWKPEVALAYRLTGLPPQAGKVTNRWSLEPADDGGTDLTLTTSIDPLPGPPGRIVAQILSRQMAKANRQMLAGLATASESHRETA